MTILRELRYILRSLASSPGYALTCIAVLALGIGANTAIFSVVYSVILTPLRYPDPSRLVVVWERFPNMPDPPGGRIQVARGNFLEWKKQNTVFADMAALREDTRNETGIDHPRHVSVELASANVFPMLGARAQLGRLFGPGDEVKDSDRVAVLSDRYFETRFQRDPRALGKSVILGGTRYTVIGVLPPKFRLPATYQGMDQDSPEVWVPLSRLWNKREDDWLRQLEVMARLKPGVTLAQARAEMEQIAGRLQQAFPDYDEGWRTNIFTLKEENTSATLSRALWILMGAVGFLLLIACANLANLTLARATLRSREIAVRLALGATRGRVIGQLLSESFVVSLAGAAAGLAVAQGFVKAIAALRPPDLLQLEWVELDLPVFGYATAIGVLTTLLFGLAPAWMASRVALNSALKTGGAHGASAARQKSRQFLIAAEVALALILVSGAGLMIRSFRQVLTTGIGFDTSRLTAVDVDLPEPRYASDAQSRFHRQLLDAARARPGIVSAGIVSALPLHSITVNNFYLAGRPDPPKDALPMADVAWTSPEYFNVLGVPLKSGRYFTYGDVALNEKDQDGVLIVNQAFVEKFFKNENPLGQRLLSPDRKRAHQIVGVVSDYRAMGAENDTRPQIFLPYLKLKTATLVVRTREAPAKMAPALREAVWAVDKDIAPGELKTLDERVDYWLAERKFNTLLLAFFACLALVLAMLGVYGVLANLVASRTREIGIRMAIGATPGKIGGLVLGQSMIPVGIGILAGLAGSLALSRFLESLLFQVRARDPLTLLLAAALLLLVSPLAIWIPLRRATRVECTIALRDE